MCVGGSPGRPNKNVFDSEVVQEDPHNIIWLFWASSGSNLESIWIHVESINPWNLSVDPKQLSLLFADILKKHTHNFFRPEKLQKDNENDTFASHGRFDLKIGILGKF